MSNSHSFSTAPRSGPGRAGLGRTGAWLLGGFALLASLWAGATTWYILCRDEFAQTFLARQAEMRFAYEDRIGELKNRLEREITAGVVERKGFTVKVDGLARRQAEIEARQAWLSGLGEKAGVGPSALRMPETTSSIAPSATDAPSVPRPASDRPTPMPSDPLDLRLRSTGGESPSPRVPERLSAIDTRLTRISGATVDAADAIRRAVEDRMLGMRVALAQTRITLPTVSPRATGVGGPYLPVPGHESEAAAFSLAAAAADAAVAEATTLSATLRSLPLAAPLPGQLEQTSGFGMRIDPFNRSAALHSGVDFRASQGAPIRATGAGRVSVAEYSGGYGNMVEIEHEGGIATRYGHLSAISVVAGQRVEPGQIVGRAGSTGRSTGSHLHYETRVDGEAVNPTRFLEAGRQLATLD